MNIKTFAITCTFLLVRLGATSSTAVELTVAPHGVSNTNSGTFMASAVEHPVRTRIGKHLIIPTTTTCCSLFALALCLPFTTPHIPTPRHLRRLSAAGRSCCQRRYRQPQALSRTPLAGNRHCRRCRSGSGRPPTRRPAPGVCGPYVVSQRRIRVV